MQLGLLLQCTRECTLQGGTACRHLGWSLLPSTPLVLPQVALVHSAEQHQLSHSITYLRVSQLLPHGPGEL